MTIVPTALRSAIGDPTWEIAEQIQQVLTRFKDTMIRLDRALRFAREATEDDRTTVHSACEELMDAFKRAVAAFPDAETQIGEIVFRESFPFLSRSSLIERSLLKPCGYAADGQTIEMVYDDQPTSACALGRLVDAWFLSIPASRAVKNRRSLMSSIILEAAAKHVRSRPLLVASLASGPALELFDAFEGKRQFPIRATCIDIDCETLSRGFNRAKRMGVASKIKFVQGNLLSIVAGQPVDLPPQDMVYSIGLIDYFNDAEVVKLLNWIFSHLQDGGLVVIGNFGADNPDRLLMDHLLEWPLIYRTEDQLRSLFGKSRFGERHVEIRREATAINLFACCTK